MSVHSIVCTPTLLVSLLAAPDPDRDRRTPRYPVLSLSYPSLILSHPLSSSLTLSYLSLSLFVFVRSYLPCLCSVPSRFRIHISRAFRCIIYPIVAFALKVLHNAVDPPVSSGSLMYNIELKFVLLHHVASHK